MIQIIKTENIFFFIIVIFTSSVSAELMSV